MSPAPSSRRWWSAFSWRALLGHAPPLARWELATYGGLLVIAAAMRLWDLGARAMHHDESLHALYSYNLANGDGYQHNPMMHGPFQFESNAAIFLVLGDNDYTARLGVALMGTLLVALPLLFRGRLGRPGALIVAAGLAVSPAMLYFSRFARNDIYMAVWSLGLVIAMWRYLDEGRNRYLYAGAALLALAFSTKETAFILVAILGSYLVLEIAARRWPSMRPATELRGLSPPEAVRAAFSGIRSGLRRPLFEGAERHGAFLVLLSTLTLAQCSAFISFFQDTPLLSWSNLVLVQPIGSAHIGAPDGGGIVVAFLVVAGLIGLSVYWGAKWRWPVWWRCAAIFWVIWVLMYSTFFTNPVGIGSGIWQSLGYWIIQQDVARGNQPWYYYFIITSVYEFLPLVFGLLAAAIFIRRGDSFNLFFVFALLAIVFSIIRWGDSLGLPLILFLVCGILAVVFYLIRRADSLNLFLVYWAMTTFVIYTIASEKMPWLLVNITLPMIVLAGRFLGEVVERTDWRRVVSHGGLLAVPGVPVLISLLWLAAIYEPGVSGDYLWIAALLVAAVVLAGLGVYLARLVGPRSFGGIAAASLAVMLAILSVRAGAIAAYENGDTPVEMLVYTQTTPDIVELKDRIEEAGASTGRGDSIPVRVDQTSGFTWPWAWYLRGRPSVDFGVYDSSPLKQAPDSSVILVHLNNKASTDKALQGVYTDGERFRHRWWFPEYTYRGLTVGEFLSSFVDRDSRRRAMLYFLNREGIRDRLDSEDAFIYFSNDIAASDGNDSR